MYSHSNIPCIYSYILIEVNFIPHGHGFDDDLGVELTADHALVQHQQSESNATRPDCDCWKHMQRIFPPPPRANHYFHLSIARVVSVAIDD
jgi:hypothetical protein